MNDPQIQAILTYLNENSGRYSLEALRGQLLQSGYDPSTVDRAIQIHQGNPPVAPTVVPKTGTGRKVLLVAGVDAVLTAVVLGGVAALGKTGEHLVGPLSAVLFGIVALEFLTGVVLSVFKELRSWGLGLLLGSILFSGVFFLLFTGWCIYQFAGQGAH